MFTNKTRATGYGTSNQGVSNTQAIESTSRVKKMLEKALKCSAIHKLYLQANATTLPSSLPGETWEIKFVSKLQDDYKARIEPWKRKIMLDNKLSDDQALSAFVFELTNAIHTSSHAINYTAVLSKNRSAEAYAKEVERIEYEGYKIHHKIMSIAIPELGLDRSVDFFVWVDTMSFEEAWYTSIRYSSHAERYRKDWETITKKKYHISFQERFDNTTKLAYYILTTKRIIAAMTAFAVGYGITCVLPKYMRDLKG